MLDPGGLLAVARLLLDETAAPVTDAQLRRAASTAYYALFHTILRAAAERFVGQSEEVSAAYGLIYRSFDHGRMTDVCVKLRASSLSAAMKRQLRRDAVNQDMRDSRAPSQTFKNNAIWRIMIQRPSSIKPIYTPCLKSLDRRSPRSAGLAMKNALPSLPSCWAGRAASAALGQLAFYPIMP